MIGSMTCPQLVADWSGTGAQVAAGQMALSEIVQREDIPTLADVNRVHGNLASVKIIAEHLISVVRFAGVNLTKDQSKETALVILSGYYYLNLAELALFFHRLKCGELGQVVYGKKINNQAIMCALHDFASERRQKIDRIIAEQDQAEVLARRDTDCLGPIQMGVEEHYAKCYESLEYYLATYPYLRDSEYAEAYWNTYRKRYEARKAENKPCSAVFITKPIK